MERLVYMDHSATTPVRTEVSELIQYFFYPQFGNPSSLHRFGREARKGVEKARCQIAEAINADADEIYFTSGGTEADNLAVIGAARANSERGKHIIVSDIEHHAVLDAAVFLEQEGFQVTRLPVNREGMISLEELEKAIQTDTVLISIMHANNEIGTVQPIAEIGIRAKQRGIIFHTDAVQSLGKIPIDVKKMNVDLLSASAHKIYGPKGAGCLYIREGVRLLPFTHGGSQEKKVRPGTENVAGIVGFGLAVELALKEMPELNQRLNQLRDDLWRGIEQRIEGSSINGSMEHRVPGHLNASFAGVNSAAVLIGLDEIGIAASAGSACTAEDSEPSHVLLAIGLPHPAARAAVRMTLGRDNTREDVEYVLQKLPKVIEDLRAKGTSGFAAGCSCQER